MNAYVKILGELALAINTCKDIIANVSPLANQAVLAAGLKANLIYLFAGAGIVIITFIIAGIMFVIIQRCGHSTYKVRYVYGY